MARQPVSRFFFFKNSSLLCKVLPKAEMQLQKFVLSHHTINTNSGAAAVVEVSKRTQDTVLKDTLRLSELQQQNKNEQQRRNTAV